MLSRELFRKDPERVRQMLERRHTEASLDRLLEVDASWRDRVARVEEIKAKRNAGSKAIGALFREGRGDEATEMKAEMGRLGAAIEAIEGEAQELELELGNLELTIPNMLADDVPSGASEDDNVEIRQWGTPRHFNFEPKAHWDLGPELGLVDFERATKISGARFAVLVGHGAALERALVSLMLDTHTQKHGYTEVMTPYLVNNAALVGTGQLPKFAPDLFHINEQDLYLIPTAEVPVTNLHREEILDESDLPKRYCAFTPCFRAEAGSYGKDVRGLIRQHQFNKVELVHIVNPDSAAAALEELTSDAEQILQLLDLPYRTVNLCSADVSFSAAKTYDLEVWLPGQDRYREISSCSCFADFQARRMHLRYRPSEGGKARFAHTVNGSGLAVGRTLVAVIENYQQADGSVVVPEALRPYMGGLETIVPTS